MGHGSRRGAPSFSFDRHLVLDQLGGWRGMVDASVPTVVFIVGNSIGGLTAGIWSALASALLVFVLRLVRRQSIQQGISGLFAVAVAVAIAAASGQARDFFVIGIVRNAVIGVVLVGSIPLRWPLIGVVAEFMAPSHLGSLVTPSGPSAPTRMDRARSLLRSEPPLDPETGERCADPVPERHWREDRRMLRAYSWLTLLWAATFLVRAVLQGLLYRADNVGLLGTSSIVLGLPVTAVAFVVTLWVVARLHRHRTPDPAAASTGSTDGEAPAA
jgi:hypothetical protein